MITARNNVEETIDNSPQKSVVDSGFDLSNFKNNPVPSNVWLQLASYLPVQQVTKVAHFVTLLGAKVKRRENKVTRHIQEMVNRNESYDVIEAYKRQNDPDILQKDDLIEAGEKAFGKSFVHGFVESSGDFATILTYLGRYFQLPEEAMALIETALIGRITDE